MSFLRSAWSEFLFPMFRRPPLLQMAALCLRETAGRTEVLLVTSSSGRWILPKGWPMRGVDAPGTAKQEAWEEAGVKGRVHKRPVGVVQTTKRFNSGTVVPCTLEIYRVDVAEIAKRFPEAGLRKAKWLSLEKAADLVDDAPLAAFLHGLDGADLLDAG